jgi:hypothetical protein
MRPLAIVRYRYQRAGAVAWTSTPWSDRVLQQSEALVLQVLRQARPGCEVELIEFRWQP